MASAIQPNMLYSHLNVPMPHTSQRLSQQNSLQGHRRRHHRRQQSSDSITSTSRDFSTGRAINRESDYPQKQLTRKPRPVSSHMPRGKQNSHSREQSISYQYPNNHLHETKENKRGRLTNKEQMNYRKRLLEMQRTNDSSGSNSNPNKNDTNHTNHFHPLSMSVEDAYSRRYSQMQNIPRHANQKRGMYDDRKSPPTNPMEYQIKKSNLDEIVGLAANDCHLLNYYPYGVNMPNDPLNEWNSNKSQAFPSYNQSGTNIGSSGGVGGNLGRQQVQFGLNTLESFQQGCLTSLASMLLCPHTILPIMVGLFSNFGSPYDYVQKLGEELVYLKQSNPYYYDQAQIGFSFWPGILPVIIASILGYILGLSLGWQLGFAVAATATLLYALFFGAILFGVHVKHWSRSIELAETISRYMRGCNLFFNILFYRSPQAPRVAQPVRLIPISINLSNFSTSTEAAVHLVEKMWISIEQKYGRLAVRLQWASRDVYGDSTKTYRKVCCLPSCLWVFVNIITLLSMTTLIAVDHSFSSAENGSKTSTTKIDGDGNTLTENLKVFIIVCAVISGLSFLILIAAITPGMLKLLHGRPFQHPIKKPFYPDLESYTDITLDSCYGNSIRKLYPEHNCIETNQCGNGGGATCFTYGNYNSNNNHSARQMLCSPNRLASAASMAAAAAAAAVTAADRHWRQIENAKMTNHHHCHQQIYERGQYKPNSEFDIEGNLNGINPKIDSNSSCRDDDDENEESTEDDSKQSDSSEHSTAEEEEEEEHVSRNDELLFNSGEFLINGQNIPASHHRRVSKKHFFSPSRGKSNSKTLRNNRRRKTISVERQKNEQLLRQYMLDACSVLSMLDRRIGGRQTRLIICISGITGVVENSITNKKLLDFMHLLDHILMKPPTGGKSYDVPLILAPIGAPEKVMNDIPPTVWVPNVVVIVTANVSGICSEYSRMPSLNSPNAGDPNLLNSMSSSQRLISSNPTFGNNIKIWHYIHQLCHLPIYIEDEPTAFRVCDQINEQSFISPARSASNIQNLQETKNEIPQPKSLIDLYTGNHELSHFNKKKFRHLLTLTAFMGRMLKLDRLFTQRTIYMSSQKNPYYLNALQYFANEPSLNTLVTWLCFLIHWPFHAAWLGVFIDNYQKCEMNVRVNYLLNDNTSRSQPEGLNQTLNGVKVKQFGIEQLGPSLTVLYTRVLKRLGPLLQTVRLKALSSFSVGSATCPTSATIHSINEPFLTNELLTSTNKTLKVCELAFYDKDPAKLGEFLKLCDSTQSGSVSINQLLRLMKLTPFINPQISKWIKEVLLPKFNIVENNVEEKGRKTTSSRSSQRSQTFNVKVDQDIDPTHPVDTRKESLRSWILKMKESVPKKPLNQFTVDEVCQLVEKIVIFTSKYQVINVVKSCQNIKSQFQSTSNETDSTLNKPLSSEESETLINDPIPPAAVNTTVDHVLIHSNIKRYTDSIRKLNITGSVLDLCSLKDLEAKINMLPVDWKMFCAFIQHLKQTECKETVATKIPNSNEHFSLLHGQFPQNHQHQKITQTSRYKFNEIDKSSVISEVRKDQLMMNTVSDTSLTVKSAPLTKDYQFDNDLKLYDHSCNDKKDRISVTNNSRSMSMTGVNKLSDSKNNAESYTHVPYYNDTNELSKQKDYPQHHSKMTERLIDNIPIPCEKHQSMLDSNIISPQSRNMHYNDKIIKSQYELRSRPCPDSIHQISHQKLKHQKSLESRVTCDGNECDCYLHNSTFQDAMTVYRAYTLPHSLQLHQQKHHHQYMHDHAVHSPRLLNTTFCSRHRLYAGDSNLANAMTAEEEMLSDNLESSSHRCIQCKPAFHAEHHHHCPHQCISDQHSTYKLVNSSAPHSHKTAELMRHSLELPNTHNHDVKKITPSQIPVIRHFNVTTDYPPPYKKDSASTSLAGEIGDEVADMSQISADENDADDTSVLLDQKLEGRRLRQISVGATADTVIYSHQCDCSYWYANEQQPPHCQHNGHYNLKQSNDKHNENSGKIIHSDIQGEQINSSLDTLSTTTNSSSNNSSNTSISNDNASGHSQLDAINSADSCDQITSESSSDNTVNSK